MSTTGSGMTGKPRSDGGVGGWVLVKGQGLTPTNWVFK